MKDKLWKVVIPIQSGVENRGFKFVGTLEVLTDELNVVYDWTLKAEKINIDRMTNNDWFSKRNRSFEIREKLFAYAKIGKQFTRPRGNWKLGETYSAQPIVLTEGTIERVLTWINDPVNFPKNEIMLLPEVFSGESRSNKEAMQFEELLYTRFRGKQIPITILLKDHVERHDKNIDEIAEIKDNSTVVSEIDFIEWAAANPDSIMKWSQMLLDTDLHKEMDKAEREITKQAVEHYKLSQKVHKDSEVEFKKFMKYIEDLKGANPLFKSVHFEKDVKGEVREVENHFEPVHIFPMWKIKQLMMTANQKQYAEYLKMISDPNNLMPLGTFAAPLFEKGDIYYSDNGNLKLLFRNRATAKQLFDYRKINAKKLTPAVKKYLQLHREVFNVDPFPQLEKDLL